MHQIHLKYQELGQNEEYDKYGIWIQGHHVKIFKLGELVCEITELQNEGTVIIESNGDYWKCDEVFVECDEGYMTVSGLIDGEKNPTEAFFAI